MRIEHVNVTVTDIEEATRFLVLVEPEYHVRGEGIKQSGGWWRHVGTDDSYIALQQEAISNQSSRVSYNDIGFNHLGFVVKDIQGVVGRLTAAGYESNDMGVAEKGRTSAYFYDKSGNEWEFVEYHSEDTQVTNNYGGN